MKTKLEILNEAYQRYKNPENRAVNDNGRCYYLAPNGNKCAVGACLKDPGYFTQNDFGWLYQEGEVWRYGEGPRFSQDHFLPEYQGHEPEFWSDLQDWHDDSVNFTETDVSKPGGKTFKALLDKWT